MIAFRYKVFLEVARHLSFSKAADRLSLSQPAISKHIKTLEQELKVSLFDRKGTSIFLTKSGEVLVNHLQEGENLEARLMFDMSSLLDAQNAKGHLKLGASTTLALYILPKILSGYRKKFPNQFISVVNRNSENITKALQNKEIDLGIAEAFSRMKEMSYKPFTRDEIVLVGSRLSPLTDGRTLTIPQLYHLQLASREPGSGTLQSVKYALKKAGYDPKNLKTEVQLGGTEALKNFVLSDALVAFLPLKAISKEVSAGELSIIPVDGLSIERQFFFITRQGEQSLPTTESFIRHSHKK
ncbi:MAG: LysR family transcriptional regulator [Bacteroidota bacterium]